jgi:hypothetical protein
MSLDPATGTHPYDDQIHDACVALFYQLWDTDQPNAWVVVGPAYGWRWALWLRWWHGAV